MGMLVLDVETRFDAVGDNSGAIPVGRRWRPPGEPTREEQSDAMGSAQIKILANHGFEEVSALDRTVEDLREADFQLAQRHAMIKSCGPILGPQRPRKTLRPPIEEALNVARPQRITRGLQRHGIGTRQKTIVQTLEADPLSAQLLLHPFVAVQTDLDRVRDVRADLDEGRAPRGILEVEVIVIDGDRLPG